MSNEKPTSQIKRKRQFESTFFKSRNGKALKFATKRMRRKEHRFAVKFKQSSGSTWFGSYPSMHDFINQYRTISLSENSFSEILSGPVHTFARLEWFQKNPKHNAIIETFEKLFSEMAQVHLGMSKDAGRRIWSTSSTEEKQVLYFKFEFPYISWRSIQEQKRFWDHVKCHLEYYKDSYKALFVNGKCIVDFSVYLKNRALPCIESYDAGSKTRVTSIGKRLPLSAYFVQVSETADYFEMENDDDTSEINYEEPHFW
jgi:hypothetical protein